MSSRSWEVWQTVIRQTHSSDMDERELALFQVSLVLERHNHQGKDYQEIGLPRELIRLALDDTRQQEIIDLLAEMSRQQPHQAESPLYALSCAQPKLMVLPLLRMLASVGATLPTTAAYQAALALYKVFRTDVELVKAHLNEYSPVPALQVWATSQDGLLAQKARWMLRQLGVDS